MRETLISYSHQIPIQPLPGHLRVRVSKSLNHRLLHQTTVVSSQQPIRLCSPRPPVQIPENETKRSERET